MNDDRIRIIYDGECPVCSSYMAHLRLKKNFTSIELINIRESREVLEYTRSIDLNIDDGMIVEVGASTYHGAEAVNVLALLSTGSGWFNAINSFVFKNPSLCRLLYPLMRFGRNLLLLSLGRKKVNAS